MRFTEFYLKEDLSDWNAYVQRVPELNAAVEILNTLSKYGKAYIVGGAVRDIIMGKDPDDIDIATNVPMTQLEKLYPSHDIGKNKDFGIVVAEYKGFNFEIAQFRTDGKYLDGRRPESVTIVSDFKDDAGRRDFTFNAMGIDKDGKIMDFFDGQKDIQNKILRTVGDPDKRFQEDFLRMLRAVRFASRLDFKMDKDTLKSIQKNADKINNISGERILKELWKMASQPGIRFANAIENLDHSGLLYFVLPEIYGLKYLKHNPMFHPEGEGTVLGHVLEALKSYKGNDPLTNFAILLHDVGKGTKNQDVEGTGYKTYKGHEGGSGELIDNIAGRLHMENEVKDAIKFAAENHMRFTEIPKMGNNKIAQLVGSKYWELLKTVCRADWESRGPEMFDQKEWDAIMDKVDKIKEKYASTPNSDAATNIKKIYNGSLIMKLRGIDKPSKEIGDVQKATVEYILDNELDINTDRAKIEQFIKEYKV